MAPIDALVSIGKQTMEMMHANGTPMFEPTLLAEYANGTSEVTLLVGGLDSETLTEGLVHVSKRGPLRSLTLTADANLRGTDQDALIILTVNMDSASTAMAPYTLDDGHVRWDDTVYADESDPRLVGALQIALSSSHASIDE